MTDFENEDRVDGRELRPLTEPGSDALLSVEATARIREAIAAYIEREGE